MKYKPLNNKFYSCSRRNFIRKIASTGFFSFFGGKLLTGNTKGVPADVYSPRVRIPNPYVNSEGKPLLIAVTGSDFQKMLEKGLEAIGGLNKLVNNNQDILIKPNFNGVDIYPAISSAESIAILAKEAVKATTGKVKVGDQGYHQPNDVYEHVNIESALSGTGADLIYFSESYNIRRSSWSDSRPDYHVYTDVYEAPVIINFACVKRHHLAKMSTALKNNVGAVTGSGATGSRNYLHNKSAYSFLTEVAEIAGLINPELTIVDARSVLAKNGPFSDSSGAEIINDVNYLIISGDMIAVDLYCSMLLQSYDSTFATYQIDPTLSHANSLGLGVKDLSEVEIIDTATGIDDNNNAVPFQFELYQNRPNPFSSFTEIGFKIRNNSLVTLGIFDPLGRIVEILLNNRQMVPGEYYFRFDGNKLSNGTYFYKLKAGRQVITKSMVLAK